jgi:hypothetical protein
MATVRDSSIGGAKDTTGMMPEDAMKYMKVKEKQMEQPMDSSGRASRRRDRMMYTSTARALPGGGGEIKHVGRGMRVSVVVRIYIVGNKPHKHAASHNHLQHTSIQPAASSTYRGRAMVSMVRASFSMPTVLSLRNTGIPVKRTCARQRAHEEARNTHGVHACSARKEDTHGMYAWCASMGSASMECKRGM